MRQRLCGMAVFSQFDISHRESLLDYILLGWLSNCECADFLNTERGSDLLQSKPLSVIAMH